MIKIKSTLDNFDTQSSLQITDTEAKGRSTPFGVWLSPSWGMQNSVSGKRP